MVCWHDWQAKGRATGDSRTSRLERRSRRFVGKMRGRVFTFRLWNGYVLLLFLHFFTFSWSFLSSPLSVVEEFALWVTKSVLRSRGFWRQLYKRLLMLSELGLTFFAITNHVLTIGRKHREYNIQSCNHVVLISRLIQCRLLYLGQAWLKAPSAWTEEITIIKMV